MHSRAVPSPTPHGPHAEHGPTLCSPQAERNGHGANTADEMKVERHAIRAVGRELENAHAQLAEDFQYLQVMANRGALLSLIDRRTSWPLRGRGTINLLTGATVGGHGAGGLMPRRRAARRKMRVSLSCGLAASRRRSRTRSAALGHSWMSQLRLDRRRTTRAKRRAD